MSNSKPIEVRIGEMLRERELLLATAESCTGGLIGQRITSVAGSSDYYAGGVITYSNAAKSTLLDVDEDVLAEYGAVSAPVAKAMAAGVMQKLAADIAVSTTGIAGPGGGSREKPVGLVFIGLALRGKAPIARKCRFDGNRKEIQMAASQTAFEMIQHSLVPE
jgi:nicotinamide-nucleotide amidase